jgi:hypothetical protein
VRIGNSRGTREGPSRIGAALFLDEADGSFGRRTDVASAYVCYAAGEANYLLEKTEKHIVAIVLTTNMMSQGGECCIARPATDSRTKQAWA